MGAMPIYEYECLDCGERFEVLQRMGEGATNLTCPKCGENRVTKQFSTCASASSGTQTSAASFGGGCGPGSGFS
jgi:putative FmdB family regulatory protein